MNSDSRKGREMSVSLGTIIKELRIKKGYTQNDLAEGICSLKQLSRIENNQSEASTYILSEFSIRLGEDLMDYIPYADLEEPFLWRERLEQLEWHYHQEHFSALYESAKKWKNDPVVEESVFIKQRIYWYHGIAACYCKEEDAYGVDDFLSLIRMTHPFEKVEDLWRFNLKPYEIRVLNSAIYVLLNEGKYDVAEEWMIALIEMFERCYYEIKDYTYLKVIYNLSRLYLQRKEYRKAIEFADKGIHLCKKNNILYRLENFCNIKGKVLYFTNQKEKALIYFNLYLQMKEVLYEDSDFKKNKTSQMLMEKFHLAPLNYLEP